MHKIAGPDGLISSGGGRPIHSLPFHYRIGNSGSLNSGYTYSCTVPGGYGDSYNFVGFPRAPAPPWYLKDHSLRNYAVSLDTPTPITPDYTMLGYGDVYSEWDDPYAGTWNLEAPWEAALAADPDAYGVLHSFTAYGAVGMYYLVDYVGCIDLSQTNAGTYQLPLQTVAGLMRRPYVRGKGTVQAVMSRYDNYDIRDCAFYRYIADGGFSEGYYPASRSYVYVPGGDTSGGTTSDGRTYSPERHMVRETTEQRAWPGSTIAAMSMEPSASGGATDHRQRGVNVEPVSIVVGDNWYSQEYVMFLDIIATACVLVAGQSVTVGLSTGLDERIAPYSHLGILFQPISNIAAPANVCGRVRVMV